MLLKHSTRQFSRTVFWNKRQIVWSLEKLCVIPKVYFPAVEHFLSSVFHAFGGFIYIFEFPLRSFSLIREVLPIFV